MQKLIFIFLIFLLPVFLSFPLTALGLSISIYSTIDSVTIPPRGISILSSITTPDTSLEMSLYNNNTPPSVIVVKNANKSNGVFKSGSTADIGGSFVAGGTGMLSTPSALSTYTKGANYIDYTKQSSNVVFDYTNGDTYSLYLMVYATCSVTNNYWCNADCSSVSAPANGWTNCGIAQTYVKSAPATWTTANCASSTCSQNSYNVFLGTINNTTATNYFFIFVNQII